GRANGLTLIPGGLLRRKPQDCLLLRGQAVPERRARQNGPGAVGVPRQRQVLLYLVEPGVVDRDQRVFLRVDLAIAQAGIDLVEGQLKRHRPQRRKRVGKQVVLHHPDTQAFQVLPPADGPPAVAEIAKSVLPKSQADQLRGRQGRQQLLAELGIQQKVRILLLVEKEWEVDHRKR